MALKGDREILLYDITCILNDVASAGSVVCYETAGSGVAAGDSAPVVQLADDPSGLVPAGMLEWDFVDIDETKFHRNFHNNEQVIGDPATLIVKGWAVTNKIIGSPTYGETAYLGASGNLTRAFNTGGGVVSTPKLGMWLGKKDADGYAKVSINLPIV